MQKNEKSKNVMLIVLLVSVISLSIAYATLTQYLYINSQTVISGQDTGWDIKFTGVACRTTGRSSITQDFTMNATNLSGLIFRINAPGDSVICNIAVTNAGVINASLSSFTIQDGTLTYTGSGSNKTADEALVNGKLQYSMVYADGDADEGEDVAAGDNLVAGTTRNVVLTITYPMSSTLPDEDVTITGLKSTFLYVQN